METPIVKTRARNDVVIKLELIYLMGLILSYETEGEIEVAQMQPEEIAELAALNVEFNEFLQRRVDGFFSVRLKNGHTFYLHIEIQAENEQKIGWRMWFYYGFANLQYNEAPEQIVLYVGEAPCNMPDHIQLKNGNIFNYRLIDVRSIPADAFLAHERPEIWAYAPLGAHEDSEALIQTIVQKLHADPRVTPNRRAEILQIIDEIGGLRQKLNLSNILKEANQKMEIIIDASKTFLFGLGKEEGIKEGKAEGKAEGIHIAARVLAKMGLPIAQIAKELNISVEEANAALNDDIKP